MYMDINSDDYPYSGEFYYSVVDKTLPLDKQEEKDEIISTVPCDIIQDNGSQVENSLRGMYSVYVPFDSKNDTIPIQPGCLFRGYMFGLTISGKVISISPSELDGYVATVKTNEI